MTAGTDGLPSNAPPTAPADGAPTPTSPADAEPALPDVPGPDVPSPDAAPDDGRLRLALAPIAHDTGFSLPTDLAFIAANPGELFMTDRDGGVAHLRLEGDAVTTLTSFAVPDTWIDGAAGLLGVAVDPNFAENQFFYVSVSISRERNVIRRYTLHAGDGAATLASQVDIFDVFGEGAPRWHNIASLGFDEGGVMWAFIGDKGLFDPAQDPADPLGSLIRILPSQTGDMGGYTVPDDQPVFGPDAHPAVFAKGIRSPWKGRYHEGRWYFGDVGKDDVEEIDIVDSPAQNFGWPLAEGPCAESCDGFVEPWIWYDRTSSHPFVAEDPEAVPTTNRSVYVGWIRQPADGIPDPYGGRWNGIMTYGDHYVGFIRARNLATGEDWHAGHLGYASAWAQGPDGFVYASALFGWPPPEEGHAPPGALYRIVLAGP